MTLFKTAMLVSSFSIFAFNGPSFASDEGAADGPLASAPVVRTIHVGETQHVTDAAGIGYSIFVQQKASGDNISRATNGVPDLGTPLGWSGMLRLRLNDMMPMPMMGPAPAPAPVPSMTEFAFTVDGMSLGGIVDKVTSNVSFVKAWTEFTEGLHRVRFQPSDPSKRLDVDKWGIGGADMTMLPDPLPPIMMSVVTIQSSTNTLSLPGLTLQYEDVLPPV